MTASTQALRAQIEQLPLYGIERQTGYFLKREDVLATLDRSGGETPREDALLTAPELDPQGNEPRSSARTKSTTADWQDISTAPSSTQVWAWDDNRGANPAMLVDGEWFITYDDAVIHPTYWMPLPNPPLALTPPHGERRGR
jgi:hypothetical protein